MAVSSKLITVYNAKQNIKNAIEAKGVSTEDTPFVDYHLKIAEINGGTEDLPQLNSHVISRASGSDTLSIAANTNNGNFIQRFDIFNDGIKIAQKIATEATTYDLNELAMGNYAKLTVKAMNEKFGPGINSNEISYGKYTITSNLTDLTTSSAITTINYDRIYTTTLTPNPGKYLPRDIIIIMGEEITNAYTYNNDTGILNIAVFGDIIITATASDYPKLETPIIELTDDLLTWSEIVGAEEYAIYANGVEKTIVYGLNINLIDLELEDNIWDITVIAKGTDYQDSNNSNLIPYYIGVIIFGVTGLNTQINPLIRTDDSIDMTYFVNSSTKTIITDFDEYFPEEYVDNNVELVFYNTVNLRWEDESGNNYSGDVFRKINKFYKQVIVNSVGARTGFKIAIANFKPPGFYCPAYFMNEEGQEMDYILIGIYQFSKNSSSNIIARSRSNSSVGYYNNFYNNVDIIKTVNSAKSLMTDRLNTFCADWRINQLLLDLFMIIFGTRNYTEVWPTFVGIPSDGSYRRYYTTGFTNSLRTISQHGWGSPKGAAVASIFLGIEMAFSSEIEYVMGIRYITSSKCYYSVKPSEETVDVTNKIESNYNVKRYGVEAVNFGYDYIIPDLEMAIEQIPNNSGKYPESEYSYSNSESISRGYLFSKISMHSYSYNRLCAQPWGVR